MIIDDFYVGYVGTGFWEGGGRGGEKKGGREGKGREGGKKRKKEEKREEKEGERKGSEKKKKKRRGEGKKREKTFIYALIPERSTRYSGILREGGSREGDEGGRVPTWPPKAAEKNHQWQAVQVEQPRHHPRL